MNYSEIALNIVSKEFASKKDKAGKPYIDHLKRVAFNSKKLAAAIDSCCKFLMLFKYG